MEAGVLNFAPEEFQIVEEIEFDETVERPEAIRFYTLQEQTTDAYEKLIPKGKITRFQRDKIQTEVDRLQTLYQDFVQVNPEDYTLREPPVSTRLNWVFPVYSIPDRKGYSWDTQWRPLFDNLRQPNFYPAMLAALPHPFADGSEGETPYTLTAPTTMVNETGGEPYRAVPDYLIPRTQVHEDKTISIVLDPASGTTDSVPFKGYFLKKRPLDLPNPLPEHPFLKENVDTFVPTTAPLKDVVPSLDAVLTHAVPVTQDPYTEATPYMKLYDIRLSEIPWASWKSKFPPVDPVSAREPPAPVEFPKPSQLAVPEKIAEAYGVSYDPGVSVRLWLMQRLDGGGLVVDMLRSTVFDNGSVESIPGADIEPAAYPDTTLAECSLAGKIFPDFNTTGVLRRTWTVVKDKDNVKLQCVPLEFIKQERGRSGYTNRLPWKESASEDMKKAYVRRLAEVTPVAERLPKTAPPPKTPARPDSVRRAEVLAILNDPERYSEDKVKDIRVVLKETTLTKNVYSDPDGTFVCCGHTLALLSGELAADRRAFYDTWTARIDGFRVCRFCSEQINNDVLVDSEEYDEEGFRIKNAEALERTGQHQPTGIADYVTGLRKLQPLFRLETPHDDTVFLVLSILQVLPSADKLEVLLKLGRTVASVQFTKGSADQIARFQGMTGLATAALLLQTHIPLLIPRRSFGSRPLILSGYPRDTDKPAEFTIVDTLITVLRKTFEAFPTSFQGASKSVVRAILNRPGEVKTTVLTLLSAKSPLLVRKRPDGKMEATPVQELLATAKAHASGVPPVEAPKTLIPVTPVPKEFGVIRSFPACPSSRPIWTSGRPPRVLQDQVPLRPGISAAKTAVRVPPSGSVRNTPAPIPKAEIRTRLGAKAQTRLRVGESYRTNLLLASRLADLFLQPSPLRTVDPSQSRDELRDVARGFVQEQLADIQTSAAKQTRLEELRTRDVALYVLQADYKEEKSQANKLRATERLKIVEDLKQKSDTERELVQQLLSIGAAPYLVTVQDREMFAREAERLQDMIREEEADLERAGELPDTGVGLARDYGDDGDEDERGVDHGDYGDRAGLPIDRDYPQAGLGDDPSRSI
jgi:hypothetical protein